MADVKAPLVIGPDHQIAAHVPARSRHKILWIVLWSLSLLVLALVTYLLILRHQNAEKAAVLAKIFVE